MQNTSRVRTFWALSLVLAGAALVALRLYGGGVATLPWALCLTLVGALAFMAEYVDSSIGMGFGTTLTPLMLLLGFSVQDTVPAILISECASGLFAAGLHHRLGNLDLSRGTPERRTAWLLSACSVVGTLAAVTLALKLPGRWLTLYIGVMVLGMGVFLLWPRAKAKALSWRRLMALGLIAAFNKGLSGGGYGPLMTGGQILSGVSEKAAIGVTSFAEGLVCLVGAVAYLWAGEPVAWPLVAALTVGSLASVPLATWTVKVLPTLHLRRTIAFATVFLGLFTLARLL